MDDLEKAIVLDDELDTKWIGTITEYNKLKELQVLLQNIKKDCIDPL